MNGVCANDVELRSHFTHIIRLKIYHILIIVIYHNYIYTVW